MAKPHENVDHLVTQVHEGDLDAYGKLFELFQGKVRMVLAAILVNSDAVDDLTQEVFITAYDRLSSYKPGTRFELWIKQIARNMALNERRTFIRSLSAKEKYRGEIHEALHETVAAMEKTLSDRDTLSFLNDCLAVLEKRCAQLIHDFYFLRRSSVQIAREAGRSPEWVRKTLQRCRLVLAECMRKRGLEHG